MWIFRYFTIRAKKITKPFIHLASSRLVAISAIPSIPIHQEGVVFNQRALQDYINL